MRTNMFYILMLETRIENNDPITFNFILECILKNPECKQFIDQVKTLTLDEREYLILL